MAMQYLPMLLQEDVNKLYPDILNFDITPPPHWNGRVSHTFFLNRRGGFVQDINFGGDKIIDYLELGNDKYGLVKEGASIKVKKNNSSTTLFTGTYTTNVNHRLMLLGAPSGAQLDTGTITGSTSSLGTFTITDSTKSRTTNAFANKYIYIQNAANGQGQVFRISSNTGTVLTLGWGRQVQPSNGATYYIFNSFSEVPAVISNDGIYVFHNDTSILQIKNYGTVVDAVYNLGRIMCVDANDNVVVGYEGYNCLFLDQTSIVGTYSGVKAMIQFQDFVLMLSGTRIGLIKKESMSVINSEVIDTFKPVTITNLIGTFSSKSFAVYNQGLYLLTSALRFVAINIAPAGTDRFTVTQEDQGGYIQQYLDGINNTNDVSIAINAEKIVIVNSSSTSNDMYLYDTYYKFWYRWNTLLPIHGVVTFNDIYFLGDKLYSYNKGYSIDSGTNDYKPYLRVIFGESDIFSLKNILMNKIYIGKNTSPTSLIKWKCHLDGGVYTAQTTFDNLKYLSDAMAYGGSGTLGSNILGFGIFGGHGISVSDYIMSAINTIEIPTNFTCSLMEIEVEGDFEFGGMIIGFESIEPSITPVNSVLGL